MMRHCPNLAKDVQIEDFLPERLFAYPKGGALRQHGTFLAEVPTRQAVSFKRLTAEEREDLENMKSSRFDQQEHAKGGPSGAGDNGDAVPLGFLSSVPGVSSLAGSSYVLSAVQYAKDNPLMALWTVGPAVCSGVLTAARSTYNYFYPPEQSWLGGWDAGLLGGAAGGAWFGGSAAASSWWPGSQPQASSGWFGFGGQPAPASSSWFGGGEAAASSSSWFGTSAAAGAAASGAAGGWFGGLFGGGEKAGSSSSPPREDREGDASGEGGFDMEDEFDMDLGGDDDEGCEQQ